MVRQDVIVCVTSSKHIGYIIVITKFFVTLLIRKRPNTKTPFGHKLKTTSLTKHL